MDVIKKERISILAMIGFFVLTLIMGTFVDQALSNAVLSPQNGLAALITALGIYPFFTAVVLFSGVAAERILHSNMSQVPKIALVAVFALLAAVIGFIGINKITAADNLGIIFPSIVKNYLAIVPMFLILEVPFFFAGFALAGKSRDTELLKRAIFMIVLLFVCYIALRATKGIFNRPRPRLVAMGLEGINFVPWYTISPDPSALVAQYNLDPDEFVSFPSGHAVLAASTIYVVLSLTWLFPELRDKRMYICIGSFVFCLIVLFSRIVLGAHYLSDVSAGAIIGLLFALVFSFVGSFIGGPNAGATGSSRNSGARVASVKLKR
jgi:membrane-associated phospholipid phosphatase